MKSNLRSLSILLLTVVATTSWALPFNQDMVGTQPATGRIMRPKAKGSLPLGSSERFFENRGAAEKEANPVKRSPASVLAGQRLFVANCSPCHGNFIDGKRVEGAVYPDSATSPTGVVSGANLNLFSSRVAQQSDGYIFANIRFGFGRMPAYGWKLSVNEHWDIVNYLRHVQGLTGQATPKQ